MYLKGLHYELLMNFLSNTCVLLLLEKISFTSCSFSTTSWHFKFFKSCNTIFCEQEKEEERFSFLLLLTHSCFSQEKKGFLFPRVEDLPACKVFLFYVREIKLAFYAVLLYAPSCLVIRHIITALYHQQSFLS